MMIRKAVFQMVMISVVALFLGAIFILDLVALYALEPTFGKIIWKSIGKI